MTNFKKLRETEHFLGADGDDAWLEMVPEPFNIAETVENTIEEVGVEQAAPYAAAMARFTELLGSPEVSADWKEVERVIKTIRGSGTAPK
jgi:hypothetical protein